MISEHTTAVQSGDADAAGLVQARALGRHRLGAELRQLRQARSLRLEDAAVRLEVVPSTANPGQPGPAIARRLGIRPGNHASSGLRTSRPDSA